MELILKCKWQLGDGKCHENKDETKSIARCNHKDRHRYNLVVCVPNTSNCRRMRIIETRNFDAALDLLRRFKEELNGQAYQKLEIISLETSKTTLLTLATEYLDALSGINTHAHLVRKRSKNHIDDNRRTIERFCICLKKKKYNVEILDLKDIGDVEAEIYHTIY